MNEVDWGQQKLRGEVWEEGNKRTLETLKFSLSANYRNSICVGWNPQVPAAMIRELGAKWLLDQT